MLSARAMAESRVLSLAATAPSSSSSALDEKLEYSRTLPLLTTNTANVAISAPLNFFFGLSGARYAIFGMGVVGVSDAARGRPTIWTG